MARFFLDLSLSAAAGRCRTKEWYWPRPFAAEGAWPGPLSPSTRGRGMTDAFRLQECSSHDDR
ncbi:hypothetical protein XFF7767_220006 [Xanthomonas citri pv. fuscans]|nr:hypothetical protein XFF7767_220006 [Xanthomonas citri pv. fuscans]